MNVLLVLALCGFTGCLAGPKCSRDELAKCFQGQPGPPGTKEEELNKTCKQTECWLEIYERCGTAIFVVGPFPVKGYRKLVDEVCDRSNPLREKYLENIDCIKRSTEGDKMKSMLNMCGIVEKPKEEFCREIPDGFRCAVDYITGACGKDAGAVLKVVGLPSLDPYDCLSS